MPVISVEHLSKTYRLGQVSTLPLVATQRIGTPSRRARAPIRYAQDTLLGTRAARGRTAGMFRHAQHDAFSRDLHDYEERYGMDTPAFHERFETGELGDSADFFETFQVC